MFLRTCICVLALTPVTVSAEPAAFATFDHAGPPVLNDPHDLAFGPDDRLYVADKFGNRIAVLDPETLDLVEVIGAGRLPGVHDIAFDASGRAVVAVTGLNAALVYDDITNDPTVAMTLPGARTEGALIHSNGRVYVMAGGAGTLIAYEGDVPVASASGHAGAHDVAEDLEGNIWVADNFNRRLVKYSPDLRQLKILAGPKFGFIGPRYLDVDEGGRLIVADQDAHRVLMIDPDAPDGGAVIGVLGDGTPGNGPNKFDDPEGVAVRGARYYIADSDNNRIVRYVVVLN